MFDTGAVLLEVFLFDFAGDLYGQNIDVAFIDWIREERMFDSAAALDCADAGRQPPGARSLGAFGRTRFRRSEIYSAGSSERRAVLARPLRHHEADQRQRDGALPAERAADLNGGGENFRIEQPRRRMRARGAFQNRAFARAAPRQQADDEADNGDHHKDRRHHQAGIDAGHLQRQPVVGGNAKNTKAVNAASATIDQPNDERRGDPGSRLNREHHVAHQAFEHGNLGSLNAVGFSGQRLNDAMSRRTGIRDRPRSPASYRGAS